MYTRYTSKSQQTGPASQFKKCSLQEEVSSTWTSGEDLSNMEGLRQEALDLAGTGNSQLVLLAELIHTQNGNDILQVLVVLHIQEDRSVAGHMTCPGQVSDATSMMA